MQKASLLALSMFFFLACGHAPVQYDPDLSSDPDPLSTIQSTIERQSPAYQPIVSVETTEKYLKVIQLESGHGPFNRSYSEVTRIIYWEDIGDIKVFHDKVWWSALFDKSGEATLYVYPLEETLTKKFINAVTIMMENQKN